MQSERYQIALIVLGVIATAFFGIFFYREIFPEYRIYQNDYISLEKFRSTYTGEPSPAFQSGVKQIVFEREDKGPSLIDRCTSCHVALQLPHFSPTKIEYDAHGNPILDAQGIPNKVANENYIWAKLDHKIAELSDEKVLEQLKSLDEFSKLKDQLKYSEELKSLKTAKVNDHLYDVTKVLRMHPLIGKETRAFEFHPIEEYGCTSCHSGNGRGLTTDKAHGPVFEGEYETEYMGPTPEFLERDPANDPRFAQIFNNKPSDALLFQTTPILVGALIQSKCVDCHKQNNELFQGIKAPSEETGFSHENLTSSRTLNIDWLTKNFRRGQQLYISQACYACHRIAGMSRGGVGPELTHASGLYPWYMKEKLVWPQGTLKTSTMPNMHLDHTEIEDLMTFLLAQKGPNQSISDIDYKMAVQEWEGGKKTTWEEPIPPSKIHDLRASMTLFATQGCSACHRLKGFESNVGFRIEKDGDKKPDFEALYREHQWFRKLFPESISGTGLVRSIDQHIHEIDKRISDHVRDSSLLEEIEKQYPDTIEALYSEFRYASRAKTLFYYNMADAATDPEMKKSALNSLEEWKNRVHRILMMYIQEYGLGRIIGPRPNWSGVYRSDQWLMEHFHNPSSHIPRSIMPIFPFDDSKFYALTSMLDVLGKKNRDEERLVWEHNGFDPSRAFDLHCAQCHGDNLQGNGPVSEWIYPIPKNLRNAEFLRNLTKENAIQSITHGVSGTPMPPWGETPKDKENYDGIPILNTEEIHKIVEWLFGPLPGGSVIKEAADVPKWHYNPQDVIDELHQEGGQLNGESKILFEVIPNPQPGGDQYAYYIDKKNYTPINLEQGEKFFEMNCAVCHGKDADGAGIRASIMFEAKPRMLTNLDWQKAHDDLRLLRSIKYGVPGTAMTPWGDLTNSLQRLQLVMYIRSLTRESETRDQLNGLLYQTFDKAIDQIEEARIAEYTILEKLQTELIETEKKQHTAFNEVQNKKESEQQALELYKQQLDLSAKVKQHTAFDQLLVELKNMIKSEETVYRDLGMDLSRAEIGDKNWELFLKMLSLNDTRFTFSNDSLTLKTLPESIAEMKKIAEQLDSTLDAQMNQLKQEEITIQGKIPSEERNAALKNLESRLSTLKKTKKKLSSSMKEASDLQKREEGVYNQWKLSQK